MKIPTAKNFTPTSLKIKSVVYTAFFYFERFMRSNFFDVMNLNLFVMEII